MAVGPFHEGDEGFKREKLNLTDEQKEICMEANEIMREKHHLIKEFIDDNEELRTKYQYDKDHYSTAKQNKAFRILINIMKSNVEKDNTLKDKDAAKTIVALLAYIMNLELRKVDKSERESKSKFDKYQYSFIPSKNLNELYENIYQYPYFQRILETDSKKLKNKNEKYIKFLIDPQFANEPQLRRGELDYETKSEHETNELKRGLKTSIIDKRKDGQSYGKALAESLVPGDKFFLSKKDTVEWLFELMGGKGAPDKRTGLRWLTKSGRFYEDLSGL